MQIEDLPLEPEMTDCCMRCGGSLALRQRALTVVDAVGEEYVPRVCRRCVARRAAKLQQAS